MFDLQVNGLTWYEGDKVLSCNFWQSPSNDEIHSLRRKEKKDGIEDFLATLITAPYEEIENNLQRLWDYQAKHTEADNKLANIYGVHVEGGLISRMGIHPKANAQEFNLENVQSLVKNFPELIKLWTLCPRMDTNGDITRFLQDSGIKVAYGHSEASYEEAMNAFEKYGVNLVTHWANAMKSMPGFKHRGGSINDIKMLENFEIENALDPDEIGLAVATYKHPGIYVTAICGSEVDNDLHLDPHLLKHLAEHKRGKFILVSDSVVPDENKTGLQGGTQSLGKHMLNAFDTGLDVLQVQEATSISPYQIFKN